MKLFDLEKNDRFLTDFSHRATEPTEPAADTEKASEGQTEATDAETRRGPQTFEFDGADVPAPKPGRRRRRWVWRTIAILLAVIGACVWIRWFNPYAEESRLRGYVVKVEKRGLIFKTYEGDIVSESRVADKNYQTDLKLSVPDDSLGRVLQSFQGSGIPVELVTERYYGILPWRGEQKTVLTAVYPAK